MPTILVTNDDGVSDPGLLALKKGLEPLGNVLVLAPDRNRSAIGNAITMNDPLRLSPVILGDGSMGYSCTGTPADCVRMAAGGVLNADIDLVVSGINAGHNMGADVYYSGTVACAREAVINGVPGIAVSSVFPFIAEDRIDAIRELTGRLACELAQKVLRNGLPPHTLLNLNTPGELADTLKGTRITRLGSRTYRLRPVHREDPFGRSYYWPAGTGPVDVPDIDTDVGAVGHGYASVTPIVLDATGNDQIERLDGWYS